MKLSYLQVRGGNPYYETSGEGPPLVLIHAGFLDSRMWDEQFRLFARGARVIRYDVRGYGRSSRPSEEYSDAEDLFALLKHLNIDRATILAATRARVQRKIENGKSLTKRVTSRISQLARTE